MAKMDHPILCLPSTTMVALMRFILLRRYRLHSLVERSQGHLRAKGTTPQLEGLLLKAKLGSTSSKMDDPKGYKGHESPYLARSGTRKVRTHVILAAVDKTADECYKASKTRALTFTWRPVHLCNSMVRIKQMNIMKISIIR